MKKQMIKQIIKIMNIVMIIVFALVVSACSSDHSKQDKQREAVLYKVMPSVKILDTQSKFADALKIYSPNVDISAANGEFETKYREDVIVDYYKKELANYGGKVFNIQEFNNKVDGNIKKRKIYSCELENGLTFYLKFDEAKNIKDKNYYAIVIHGSTAMMASYNSNKDKHK